MPFKDEMEQYDNEWESMEVDTSNSGGFGPQMPDGQHQALLVDARVTQRQSDEHWQLYWKWQNPRGFARDWRDLDHDKGREIAKKDLALFGYDGLISDVEEALPALIGLVCNIGVKTTPGDTRDFVNVYLNGVIGPATDPDLFKLSEDANQFVPSGERAGGDDEFSDDIPF